MMNHGPFKQNKLNVIITISGHLTSKCLFIVDLSHRLKAFAIHIQTYDIIVIENEECENEAPIQFTSSDLLL